MTFRFPRVVGHRGASADAPENTLAAFRLAALQGAGAIELDAKLSRDGVPVVIHDATLERTTNGYGAVAAQDFVALDRLDAGTWFDHRFAREKLPTLRAVLELCAEVGLELNIEIKPCPGRAVETAQRVVEDVRRFWPGARPPPILSCFQAEGLEAARRIAPELPRGFLVDDLDGDWRSTARQLDCVALHVGHRALGQRAIATVRAAGLQVLAWTVNDPARARALLEWGASAIITDRPAAIHAALA